MKKILEECCICPHNCKANRLAGKIGRCKANEKVKIALYSIHRFEEPCISGGNGSGTVFFSNCNLQCQFCQNYEISQLGQGKEISIQELADIFLKQQEKQAENINLVTPTSYVPQIIEALKLAKEKGLYLPIIYNTNGYETVDTIKLLDGYIDIYLPDFKYADNKLAKELSDINNYFEISTEAIKEMYKQVGSPIFNKKGVIQKGVIIRHLVLPNYIENTKQVLEWICKNLSKDIYVSVMAQYFPTYRAKENEKLNRKLTKDEWEKVLKIIEELEIENGYVQELGEHEEEYVPKWEYKN